MYTIKKNDPAFQELKNLAKQKNLKLKELLLSDEHLQSVCSIFYKNSPKMVRWSMKEDKFIEFYKKHREKLVEQVGDI